MSYDIYIGNAELDWDAPGEYGKGIVRVRVNGTTHPDAPVFPNDQMTRNSNSRHPGYSAWSRFCDATGLNELFYAKYDGLMCEHPGIQQIVMEEVEQVEAALTKWRTEHPDAVPGFEGWEIDLKREPVPENCDPILARLMWLAFWMRWAVENCERPAIFNS